ncbi:MAG: putative lipid II flippase FtsW [Gammaproteobacteria bacterium]|nr:putative lipid II flippase FtsW [Gammaproteobacteria bacterium]
MSAAVRQPVALDPALIASAVGLAALGTVMVGSASISIADNATGEPFYYLIRHLGALAIGCAGLGFAAALPIETWYRSSGLCLLAALLLLAAPLVPSIGQTVNGATRWVAIGPLRFQPSEPARLLFLIYVAAYCVRHYAELTTRSLAFWKPLLLLMLAAALLLKEPDFGAVVVLTATTFGVLFLGGARLRDVLAALCVAGTALAILAVSSAYRLERLLSFLEPFEHAFDSGFQLTQSLIAIGRGDWFGVGLGESVQKLFYLPEAHTDFVFAVLAEELGLLGSTGVIVLFAVLVYRAISIGQRSIAAGLPFHGLLAMGIGITLGLQAFINIGVNTGLLPTKGLTLPLLSYGRSSTITTLVALGLLFRVHHELAPAEMRRAGKRNAE